MFPITTDFSSTLSTTAGQTPATPVHGPRLAGAWRRVGILAWAILFLACLAALIMSVAYADLWYRTPYTSIQTISADTDPAAIEATIRPFQEAINGLGLTLDLYSHYFTVLRLLAGLPYFILSVLIIRRRSDRLMAVLFAMVLCLLGAAGTWFTPLWAWIPETYPWHPALSKLLSALLFCCIAILYTFPDGRFVPRWTRWLAVLVVPFALASNFAPAGSVLNPNSWPGPLGSIPNPFFLGCGVFAIVYRYRHYADAVQKQQLKWFVAGSVLITLSWFVDFAVWQIYPTLTRGEYLIQPGQPAVLWELFQDTAWYIAQFAFAVCIAISVFRYRLWDIDLVINRVLVYGSLTALTMLVYLAAVTALGSLFEGLADRWAFFLATGLVAILFEPFRHRLQRLVNRLMYGERDDPYGVLTQLSSALETAPTPQEVLPALAAHIGQALKIPYVDIRLQQDDHDREEVAAFYGKPQDELLSFPLVYQEEGIGRLQLARRAPGEEFSSADRRLIENIARQAGAAAQSVRLHAQLLRSRAQIVSEREEERLRIRRDLHDELGPILASQGLRLAAARQLIRSAPEKAEGLVDVVAQQSQTTVNEIRRLVHGLRPPALDQLGLVDAVRDLISQSGQEYNQHGMAVEITASPNPLPKLPAAVEVNAYRIVLEAISNVTRHAQAGHCTVKFQVRDDGENSLNPAALLIQINDDGVGLQGRYREGVGLRSMRQRAEEIGGKFTIEPAQPHGTALTAWLPLSL
jgi:signal transduction histidine kinase